MDEMFNRVEGATMLAPHIAKAAIGHVLLFLRDEVPGGRVGAFIDGSPRAKEFVSAALARSDGGVTQFIEGMTAFVGNGRWDLNALAGKLANLGLTEAQTDALLREVIARAEVLIGDEAITDLRDALPSLRMRSMPHDKLEERRAI